MNCLGRGNYGLFLGMLMSLGVLLSYGVFLAHMLLDQTLTQRHIRAHGSARTERWNTNLSISQKFDLWAWAFTEDIRVGAVGLLSVFTAPLAWGLLLYHIYLIWAGMTTSESFKWDEWKDDVLDGYVYKCMEPMDRNKDDPERDENSDPHVPWPVSSTQRLVSRANQMSMSMEPRAQLDRPPWTVVRDLGEVINIYDLGFWDNLVDVFRLS